MKYRLLLLALLFSFGISLYAVPALRIPFKVVQPDGTVLVLSRHGDEYASVLTTADGCAVVRGDDGFYYFASFDSEGNMGNSGCRVGTPAPQGVVFSSRNIPLRQMRSASMRCRPDAPALAGLASENDEGKRHHVIVLLAEFADLPLTYTKEDFQNLLTQKGYSFKGATGSVLDYFNDQCEDKFDISFEAADPVTLSHGYAYYGEDDTKGSDKHDLDAFKEACRLADPYVDFSLYDDIFMYYAGGNPADGGADDDHIWPKAYKNINIELDGRKFTSFAMSSELRFDGESLQFASIGTFCHEFSHVLGLKDMYDVDYEGSGGQCNALWGTLSIMDNGNYNNGGNTPPCYTSIELEMLGIAEPEELRTGEFELEPLSRTKRFFRLDADCQGEYFLFECRAVSGWDKYIGGSGMLIYHVDKSSNDAGYCETYDMNMTAEQRWQLNEVNGNPKHECAALVAAAAQSEIGDIDRTRLFFPYPFNSTSSFTPHTDPAFVFWSGYSPWLSIASIKKTGDVVRFEVTKPLAIDVADIYQDAAILNWHNDLDVYRNQPCTLFWGVSESDMQSVEVKAYDGYKYAFVIEDLEPNTSYMVKIVYEDMGGEQGISLSSSFVTEAFNGRPFIYLNEVPRTNDYFKKGSKLPLRVYNAQGAVSVKWYFNGEKIQSGVDGYYEIRSDGDLKAVVDYSDGSSETIFKKVKVK